MSMDVLELFPRHILEGDLEQALLGPLQRHAEAVLQQPERSPDASAKLAGQLTQQRELSLQEPAVAELCSSCLLYTSPSPRDATLSRMPSSA